MRETPVLIRWENNIKQKEKNNIKITWSSLFPFLDKKKLTVIIQSIICNTSYASDPSKTVSHTHTTISTPATAAYKQRLWVSKWRQTYNQPVLDFWGQTILKHGSREIPSQTRKTKSPPQLSPFVIHFRWVSAKKFPFVVKREYGWRKRAEGNSDRSRLYWEREKLKAELWILASHSHVSLSLSLFLILASGSWTVVRIYCTHILNIQLPNSIG